MTDAVVSHDPRRLTHLSYAVADGVGICTLNRPDRLNSLSVGVFDELDGVLDEVSGDESLCALILRGEGDVFSVGLDRDELDTAFADTSHFRSLLVRLADLCGRLEALRVPVIAEVNGLARAGALEIILSCDFVLMASEARVGDVHTSFGVVSGAGLSFRLARAIGTQRAKEVVYTARWMDADEAHASGLALKTVPRSELGATTLAFARALGHNSSQAIEAAKRQFSSTWRDDLDRSAKADRDILLQLIDRPDSDAMEGFRAFQEGRKARWEPAPTER